jgi:HK97 family phage major capsid protein
MPELSEIKQLQEQIANTFEELKTRNDKAIEEAEKRGGESTAETKAALDKANEEISELRKQANELEKRMNRPNFNQDGGDKLTPEMQERQDNFIKYLRNGRDGMSPEESRALAGTSDADGGIFIPPTFESGIIMNAYDQAEVRPLCQVGKTGRDRVVLGSLSKPSIAWGRKAIAVTAQDLTSGGKIIDIFFLQALTAISIDTLEDSEADIVNQIMEGFSMAVAEAEDDAFVVGAGDDSPKGIATDSTVQANYSASGVADALYDASNNGADAIIGAKYKIKKTYRKKAAWAMNSTTEGVVRKLKDGDGRYLWQPSLQVGTPPTFDGNKIVNPEGMADIAAGTFPILFGDFQAYKIRDRSGMSVQRLVEKYAEYAQIGFLIRRRVGGALVLPEAFSCVKIAAS